MAKRNKKHITNMLLVDLLEQKQETSATELRKARQVFLKDLKKENITYLTEQNLCLD